MSTRAFDAVWLCGGRELERRTIQADDMDAALLATWMDMPTISHKDREPCDTMRITDTVSGRTVTEDVPPFTPPSRRIGTALLTFVAGCVALPVGIWMARHGWARGSGLQGKAMIYSLMAFPFGWIIAIVVVASAQQSRQDAVAQWKKDFGDLRPATAPNNPRLARVIVARYSLWRELPRLALGFAIIGALLWFPLASRFTGGYWQLWHPIILACGAALLVLVAPQLRQLLFDRGAALWIQSGELVQCSRMALCVPIWGITGVAVGEYQPPKGFPVTAILLTGKDGSETPIAPLAFREPPEEVAARLNTLLRLSQHADMRTRAA